MFNYAFVICVLNPQFLYTFGCVSKKKKKKKKKYTLLGIDNTAKKKLQKVDVKLSLLVLLFYLFRISLYFGLVLLIIYVVYVTYYKSKHIVEEYLSTNNSNPN